MSGTADYAVTLPPAVRRAAERAEQLSREFNIPAEPPAAEPGSPSPEPTVTDTTVVEPAAPAAPAAPATTVVVDWEQRYRSLQGKYNAEVPALRSDLTRVTSEMDALRALVAARDTPPAAPAQVPAADVDTYGEDLVTAARRWARTEMESELTQLRNKVAHIEQTTNQVQQTTNQVQASTAHQRTLLALDAHPDVGSHWRATNNDPAFLDWLNADDEFTGQPRMALLRDAFGRGEVARTAKFFQAFAREHTAPRTPQTNTATPPEETARPGLEVFASPGRATAPTHGGAQADKRIWSQRDIQAFYADKMKGKYRDREAEAARLEQDLFLAPMEGRIR